MQNPYWINYRNLRNNDKKRYMLSISANYDILDFLSVSGRVRIDNANNLFTQKLFASSNATITEGGKNGHYTEARTNDTQTYADLMVVFIVRDYSVGVDGRSREVGLVAVGASADGEGIGVRVSRFKIFLWGVVIA